MTPRPARRGDQRHRKPVYQLLRRAPSRTRTDTGRILSPLPLPIGLWGRCSSEHHLTYSASSRLQTRYRSAVDRLTQRIGHTGQIIVEAMAVSVERHRSCRVPQESLHNLDVSACTDRQGRRGVPQAVRYQPSIPISSPALSNAARASDQIDQNLGSDQLSRRSWDKSVQMVNDSRTDSDTATLSNDSGMSPLSSTGASVTFRCQHMTGHEKRLFRIEVVLSIAIVRPESIAR
jgi:hypothetical protein